MIYDASLFVVKMFYTFNGHMEGKFYVLNHITVLSIQYSKADTLLKSKQILSESKVLLLNENYFQDKFHFKALSYFSCRVAYKEVTSFFRLPPAQ